MTDTINKYIEDTQALDKIITLGEIEPTIAATSHSMFIVKHVSPATTRLKDNKGKGATIHPLIEIQVKDQSLDVIFKMYKFQINSKKMIVSSQLHFRL